VESFEGTVTKIEGQASWVDAGPRGRFRCDLRGKISRKQNQRLAVGDRVRISEEAHEEGHPIQGMIEEVLPRRSVLNRPRSYKRDQVICANLDQVIVVVSVFEPAYKRNFIDRLLVGIERESLVPVIVFNKLDLADEAYREVCARDASVYRKMGYGVVGTSVPTGEGIDDLRAVMKDKLSAVAGPSGVGKSTLLNAIVPGLHLRVGEVSESSGRGKHTTTSAELVAVPGGGFVVDTPGIRAFGLWDVAASSLPQLFRDIFAVGAGCKFRDCSHREEPGCLVIAAVEAGTVDEERYDSYVHLRTELESEESTRQATRKR
jgi:ribosome biogenesis GTPase